jgi:UDP-glucuronate 4-epimerase
VNLLSKAAEEGVARFVFGSSSSVYGADNEVPFSEDQRITMPISPYAASKVAGEAYCHSFHHLYDLPVVCLRFFTVFGPRQRPDLAMNKFIRLILADQPIPVYGDGSASRDFTYVGDIVRGIMAAAEHPDLASPDTFETINLGSDEPITVLEMVAAIEDVIGRQAQIDWQPLSPGDVPRTWANVRKAKTLLNWQPQVSIQEGLSAFADWYRQQADANGVE